MDVFGQVIRRSTLTANEKIALIVLARLQGPNDHCKLSASALADVMAISQRTAQATLRGLAKKHEIVCKRNRIKRRLNETNSYSVVLVNNINRRREEIERECIAG